MGSNQELTDLNDPLDLQAMLAQCLAPAVQQYNDNLQRARAGLADAIRAFADQVEGLGTDQPTLLKICGTDQEALEQSAPSFDISPVDVPEPAAEDVPGADDATAVEDAPAELERMPPPESVLDIAEPELVGDRPEAWATDPAPIAQQAVPESEPSPPEPLSPEVDMAPVDETPPPVLSDPVTLQPSRGKPTVLVQPTAPRGQQQPASQLSAHLFAEAKEQLQRGDQRAALARFKEVVKLDPLFVPVYRERGQLLRNLGKFEQALADLQYACQLDPDDTEAQVRRANVLVDLGQLDEAIAAYTRAIERDPQQPLCYLNRGLAQARKKNFADVIADADQALALDPDLADAYFIRGYALHRVRRLEEALADYTRLLELTPQNPLAWNERGLTHVSRGQYAEAIRDYVQALKLNPKLLLVRYNRGIAYRLKGDYDMAIADFSEILRRKPKNHQAAMNRGMCHFARGDYERALPDFARAAELAPNNEEINRRLAEVRAALKEQHNTARKDRSLRLAAKKEAPSRQVTVECPECGAQGDINWDRLDFLFQCKGCGDVYRVDNCGRLTPVKNVEKFAQQRAAKTMPALPTVATIMQHAAAQPSAAPAKVAAPAPFKARRPRLFGVRGLNRWHLIAVVLLVALAFPISMVYALKNTVEKRWRSYTVGQLVERLNKPGQAETFADAQAEVGGLVQSASEGESPTIVVGGLDGERIVCVLDGYALSTKRQLPTVRTGAYVIIKGTFDSARAGEAKLKLAHLVLVDSTPPPRPPHAYPIYLKY